MRAVLVTGGTGAIGSVLAKYLLEEEGTKLRLLLRAQSSDHLASRLHDLYRFWGLDPADRSVSARVEAIAGDVTLRRLGLDEPTYRRLTSEVTHVVHSAGNVKLNRPLAEARQSAVDPAHHIVSFAEACRKSGPFQKLEFVSTIGVAGRMAGIVPERPFPESRSFRNSYEAAKAEAETFLLGQMNRGLPATIHRPSMVVGDSRNGRIIQFQVFYYLCELLSGGRTGGIIPNARDVRLDIIPVDYVARAIELSTRCAKATGRIFHLCAGPEDAPSIMGLANRVRDIFFAARGRRMPPLRPIPPALIRTLLPLASRLAPGMALRRALRSLPHFLAYLDTPQTFANVRTLEFFTAAGVSLPRVDAYLEPVLSYYLSATACLTRLQEEPGASQYPS